MTFLPSVAVCEILLLRIPNLMSVNIPGRVANVIVIKHNFCRLKFFMFW